MAQEGSYCLADDVVKVAHAVGIDLLEWQVNVLRDWMQVDEYGQFVHRRVGLSVPRQSGKSFLVIALCVYLMLVQHMRIAFTAHNYSTVGDIFDRFKKIFGYKVNDPHASDKELNALVKNIRGATSRESIELLDFGDGLDPCASFSTRTDSSLRGQSFDILVIDEAQELTSAQLSSILPVTNSGPAGNPLTIYIGTPETPASRGDVFRNIRQSAIDGDEDICWLEWSVDEIGDVKERERWYLTNPSLGILSDESVLKAASGSMHEFDFAQEYLGYWYQQSIDTVIDINAWNKCKVEESPSDGIIVYGVKFAPDGSRGCIAVCCKPKEGLPHIEVVKDWTLSDGLQRFVDFLYERKDKAAQIVIDGPSNSQTLIEQLIAAGLPTRQIERPNARDVIAANAALLSAINEGSVTHFGQEALDVSATQSAKRKIGQDGGWGFKSTDKADAGLIEACAIAYRSAMNTKRDPNRKMRIG